MQRLLFVRNFIVGGVIALSFVGCSEREEAVGALYVREIVGNVFETTPVRGAFRPLRNRRTGFEYKCSECHTGKETPVPRRELVSEHAEIQDIFTHGENTACVSCHHATDRNVYVAHDGTPISPEEPARLCGKCHGPTYRDWRAGTHGRQNGYWDKALGAREALVCVQCHDPHRPKFERMTPDRPPIRSRLNLDAPGEEH